jgi:hypothetical protein
MPKRSGKVYLLWLTGTSAFKIGFTARSVSARAKEIAQSVPVDVRVLGWLPAERRVERLLHRTFARYRTQGEWFSLPPVPAAQLLTTFGYTFSAAERADVQRLQRLEDARDAA